MMTHRFVLGCAVGALLLLLDVVPSLAGGPIVRLTPPEGARSVSGLYRDSSSDKLGEARAVVLSGEIRFGRREGLSVGGVAVRMGAATGIFPELASGRLPSPSSLQGKHATVMGMWNGGGVVEARLILLQETRLASTESAERQPGMVPSDSDPDVGELTASVPN